jgi:prepilin-type N-terminal cleavage/methylation domain-containing protein
MHSSRAFSLVEVMIASTILAILAMIAVPAGLRSTRHAQNIRTASDLRTIAAAFDSFAAEHKRYPGEVPASTVPAGMEKYLRAVDLTGQTPLGGRWDYDFQQGYATAAICLDLPAEPDPIQMAEIDKRLDNGVLSTGNLRELSQRRYAFILR